MRKQFRATALGPCFPIQQLDVRFAMLGNCVPAVRTFVVGDNVFRRDGVGGDVRTCV